METPENPRADLYRMLEDDMVKLLETVKKDRDRERHFHNRVKQGLADIETHRQFLLKKDPNYKFKVKVPQMRKLAQPGQLPYGHFTGLAMKVLRELKGGTFPELRARALDAGIIKSEDAESVRQALYQLKRRGVVKYQDGVFSMKPNNKAAPDGKRLHRPEAIVDADPDMI